MVVFLSIYADKAICLYAVFCRCVYGAGEGLRIAFCTSCRHCTYFLTGSCLLLGWGSWRKACAFSRGNPFGPAVHRYIFFNGGRCLLGSFRFLFLASWREKELPAPFPFLRHILLAHGGLFISSKSSDKTKSGHLSRFCFYMLLSFCILSNRPE